MYFSLCILWIYYNRSWQLLIQLNEHIIKNPRTQPHWKNRHLWMELKIRTHKKMQMKPLPGGCTAWAVPKPGGKRGSSLCLWWLCFLCFNQTQMLKKEWKAMPTMPRIKNKCLLILEKITSPSGLKLMCFKKFCTVPCTLSSFLTYYPILHRKDTYSEWGGKEEDVFILL